MSNHPTATAPLLRQLNGLTVLEYLWSVEQATGSEIMDATKLSRPTVHAACDDLISRGVVVELAARPAGGPGQAGRPARCYQFNAALGSVLGIDLGEWKVTVLLADLRGRPMSETTVDLPSHLADARERVTATRAGIRRVLREAPATAGPVLCAGVGVAAAVRPDGSIYPSADPSYLPGMADIDLPAAIGRGYPWPVLVDNDANLALLAERSYGVATGADDVVLLLAGERLGAGILANGKLLRGHGGAAGELAFLELVDGVGNTHGIGAVARMLGEDAIRRTSRTPGVGALPPFTDETLLRLAGDSAEHLTGKLVADAARAGDTTAQAILDHIAERIARVVIVLSGLLNPQLVVIGGGASGVLDQIGEDIRRQFSGFLKQAPQILASTLGDRAVVLGAVQAALQQTRTAITEEHTKPGAATSAEGATGGSLSG